MPRSLPPGRRRRDVPRPRAAPSTRPPASRPPRPRAREELDVNGEARRIVEPLMRIRRVLDPGPRDVGPVEGEECIAQGRSASAASAARPCSAKASRASPSHSAATPGSPRSMATSPRYAQAVARRFGSSRASASSSAGRDAEGRPRDGPSWPAPGHREAGIRLVVAIDGRREQRDRLLHRLGGLARALATQLQVPDQEPVVAFKAAVLAAGVDRDRRRPGRDRGVVLAESFVAAADRPQRIRLITKVTQGGPRRSLGPVKRECGRIFARLEEPVRLGRLARALGFGPAAV